MIRPADLIERKRNGEELPAAEIAELVLAYARDEVPDYQMAAWCMAVYLQGPDARAETFALTDAMIRSGDTLDLGAALGRKVVDKHSTGGVGDKTSIAVGPIVAACGVPLGKMSGRGLGHTGGTLDKLEAIPGFRVELTTDEMIAQLRDVGMAIVGQSAHLVPADKKLYALRDVTATVDIVPLIASSIMSKKLAAGADAIVLDVKVGDGAFMKTLDEARVLAQEMLELGRRAGKEVTCLLTDMDQPLGRAVGNALEIREALDTVRGEGPADFTELVLDACARLLAYSDLGIDVEEGRRRAEAGGRRRLGLRDLRAVDPGAGRRPRPARAARGARAACRCRRRATASSRALGALAVGVAALELGAGRRTKADAIDPRRRRALLRQARRRGARGRRPRRGARARRAQSRRRSAPPRRARRYTIADEAASRPPRGILPRRRTYADVGSLDASMPLLDGAYRRADLDWARAGAARGRDRPPGDRAGARRGTPRARRDSRCTPGAAVRPGDRRRRARRGARGGRRAPWQVSDCGVRFWSVSARAPPDDGVVAVRGDGGRWPTILTRALFSD